jgi:uncharacterized damage-inducible protein DinB
MKKVLLLTAAAVLSTTGVSAQSGANPLSSGAKGLYTQVKNNVLKAAEEMPEQNYSFKPVSTVRSFGQLVAHEADGQYEFCSAVANDGKKAPDVEGSKTTKADLIEALKTAFAYCDASYNKMTDATGAETVKFFNGKQAKLAILNFNTAHTFEHYGNMVTYLRMKGLVPPSSQQ